MKDLLSVNVVKHLTLSFPLFREQRSLKFPQLAFSEKKKVLSPGQDSVGLLTSFIDKWKNLFLTEDLSLLL